MIAADDCGVSLLVSTSTGGDGSQFAEHAPLETVTTIEGPLGAFRLEPGHRSRVFVATGTGLAPLLPMFAQLRASGDLATSQLIFGCRDDGDDLAKAFNIIPGKTLRPARPS